MINQLIKLLICFEIRKSKIYLRMTTSSEAKQKKNLRILAIIQIALSSEKSSNCFLKIFTYIDLYTKLTLSNNFSNVIQRTQPKYKVVVLQQILMYLLN